MSHDGSLGEQVEIEKKRFHHHSDAIRVNNLSFEIPYTRHYKLRFVYFLSHFSLSFLCFQEGIFLENSFLVYGKYSRVVCNQISI